MRLRITQFTFLRCVGLVAALSLTTSTSLKSASCVRLQVMESLNSAGKSSSTAFTSLKVRDILVDDQGATALTEFVGSGTALAQLELQGTYVKEQP